jgi:hypothetical protein
VPVQAKLTKDAWLQRQEEEVEEEEEEPIQAKQAEAQVPQIGRGLEAQICSLRDSGRPLPGSARNFFEPRFGHDFSQVRVHTDRQAAETARAVKARACTLGRDIAFGAGQYAPGTAAGARLLAHELTHVVQQDTGARRISPQIQKKERAPTKHEILDAWLNDWARWEAEKAKNPKWELDCGEAARDVFHKTLGGKRWKYVLKAKSSPTSCSRKECNDANSRSDKQFHDGIVNGELHIHSGKPGKDLSIQKVTLKPGMLIYTAERCKGKGRKSKRMRWTSRHMMMYYGDSLILDSIKLKKPEPHKFKPVYVSAESDFFVVLEVYDPFMDMRR